MGSSPTYAAAVMISHLEMQSWGQGCGPLGIVLTFHAIRPVFDPELHKARNGRHKDLVLVLGR